VNAAGIPASLPLVRLLQLASPALPIGAYSYSQGLEWVVAEGIVHDAVSSEKWIREMMEHVVAPGEAVVVWRLLDAAAGCDWSTFERWNAWYRASRETAELRAETEQTGGSLVKLAVELGLVDAPARAALVATTPVTLPAAYAVAAHAFDVLPEPALVAYLWSWLENQVIAAMKLVPLGQVAGQRLLHGLGATIPAVVTATASMADDDITTFAPGLALASARHETQYTRLFRS